MILAQVSPNYYPYSIINTQSGFNTSDINYTTDFQLDFMQYARVTLRPDALVYRLQILFDNQESNYFQISNCNIPEGAMIFVINNDNSYTGPYLKNLGDTFTTGRFFSHNIIFEYVVPINAIYSGNFIIDGLLSNDLFVDSTSSINKYEFIYKRERPKILVTGYWPPTNEMVRHFSQNNALNPKGWKGENWEGSGYDIVSFFPEFDPPNCNNCGQGYGDLEVDYQDYSQDFWQIVELVQPIAIITFSRGFNDMSWEIENRLVNRTNWYDDYTPPLLPTPNPPDATVNNYHIRYSSLPVDEIILGIQDANLGLNPYVDNTNAGMYLSEFSGYHGVWYKEMYYSDSERACLSAGHIHVGAQVDWDTAREAAEISIRALIEHINQFVIILGDCNSDSEVNILDIVLLAGVILGNNELTPTQVEAADMDNNQLLNILDIISIINLILSV